MICSIIEYLNVWYVCLRSCEGYNLCFFLQKGVGVKRVCIHGKNHFASCKIVLGHVSFSMKVDFPNQFRLINFRLILSLVNL